MSDINEIEYQRGLTIGQEVMACFGSTMTALDAEGRALVPDPDDPTAIFRRRLELADLGLAEVDRIIDQIQWLMDGQVPDEIRGEFARYRATVERARGDVELQLIQAIAQLN